MVDRTSRFWEPHNPGLPDLNSNGPIPPWRTNPGLSDMVMWLLQANGHLTSSREVDAGRGDWWPTITVADHVPRSDSDFVDWLVQETPARSWSRYDLAKLRPFCLFHGLVVRNRGDEIRNTFRGAVHHVDIDAPFGIGLCERPWDKDEPWTANDFHDVRFYFPDDGLEDAHSFFTKRTSRVKIENMQYWIGLGFEPPTPDARSS